MAGKNTNWKSKLLFLAALPLLNLAYQLVGPYLDQTNKMRIDLKKAKDQIRQTNTEAQLFSNGWDKQITADEEKVAVVLPHTLVPSEILRYFATSFESSHEGVQFTSLIPQSPVQSQIIADKENPSVKMRVSKLQIKARMPSEYLFSYLEHVENYPGILRIQEVGFFSASEGPKKNILSLEMSVELYFSPKEWIPKSNKIEVVNERSTASNVPTASLAGSEDWFSTGNSQPKWERAEAEKEKVAPKPSKPPRIRVSQVVGSSVVIGEDLYEVGDHIQGWTVSKIDSKTKLLWLKKENEIFKVVIP